MVLTKASFGPVMQTPLICAATGTVYRCQLCVLPIHTAPLLPPAMTYFAVPTTALATANSGSDTVLTCAMVVPSNLSNPFGDVR